MTSLEEQIVLEKLTGKCPIYNANKAVSVESQFAETEQRNAWFTVEDSGDTEQAIEKFFEEIDRCLRKMDTSRENYAFRHIYSCRAVIGKFIVFCKRVIRKCLKWYIEPICNQQTEFNDAVTPAVGRLTQLQRSALNQIQQADDALRGLKESSEKQEKDILQVRKEQASLIQQLQEIQVQVQANIGSREHIKFAQDELQNQMNMVLQELSEAMEQLRDLREQGAFAEVVTNEKVMKKSTAQTGEDMIVAHILREQHIPMEQLTYLDLGANHAKFLSNTYYLYQNGVRGVLVEANPALIGELKFYRSGDIILNRCIATTSGETVDFYVLNGDGLSTPDKGGADASIAENPMLKIDKVVPVKTITVEEIIDTYFDKAPTIINLDIEGEEMNILNSIDFTKHRPLIMIIETIPYRKHLAVGLKNQEIIDFMIRKNYIEYAFTGINSIFLDKEQIAEVLE